MHPTFAQYLDLHVAWETLELAGGDEPLEGPAADFAAVASAHPEVQAAVLAGKGRAQAGEQAEQALVLLAALSAVRTLERTVRWETPLQATREALYRAGATEEEASAFLAKLVVEEAFAFETPADSFDEALFEETLASIPALLGLDESSVAALLESFVKAAPARKGTLYRDAAKGLLEQAWADGAEPIAPEHVQAAREALGKRAGTAEALKAFIARLAQEELVGPLRRKALEAALV
ncbi:MAG: hypothetical protein FJ086_03655 [Deltaproteobacteria bacterium]|nr:hypothetical protein [Deltaproteobacteria bacterium]